MPAWDTTDGNSIWLFRDGNLIVGRVGSGPDGNFPNSDGAIAFAVSIDPATGVVSVGQYLSLEHPTGGSSHDEAIALANGAIQAIATVTDGDGDVATDSVSIGRTVSFQDDGPSASICLTGVDVSHDESAGRQSNADDVSTRPAAFAGLEAVNHLAALGWAVSPGPLVTVAGSTTGADNEGATSLFSLKIPGGIVNSGVDTTDGQSIFLLQEGDLIVGRVGSGAGGNSPDSHGDVAFAVSIDSATGIVCIGQYLSLEHPVGGSSYDESIALATGAIQAVVTVTDGDGDVSTDTADIGGKIVFQDDGPVQFDPEDQSLGNTAGTKVAGDLDIAGHTGVDGFDSINFANITNGQVAIGSVGGVTKTLKCGGETIYLFTSTDDTMLTGTTDPTGKNASDTVFTLTLNGSGDSYLFNLAQPIDNGAGIAFNYFGNAGAGNNRWIGIFTDDNAPSDGDPNHEDLLLTPINAKYVNTSATDIGVDNQHINPGEGVRIDFVIDVDGNQKSVGGFSMADHFLVTDSSFRIVQIQGSGSSDAVVRIRAYDADNDTNMSGDKGDVAVALELDGLTIRNASGTIVPPGTGGVQAYMTGGDIVIDGLKEGYSVEVRSDTPYDRLEITNADGLDPNGKGCDPDLDGKAFEISTISVIQTAEGADVALHYDTRLGDGDGDTIVSSDGIDLSLLASAMAIPTAVDDSDVVAGQGDQDDTAFAYQQSADVDADTAAQLAATSLADQNQGQDAGLDGASTGTDDDGSQFAADSDGEAQDLWAAVQLDYNAIAEDRGEDGNPLDDTNGAVSAIAVVEVLDGADGGDNGDRTDMPELDSGPSALDQTDDATPDSDAVTSDATEPATVTDDSAMAADAADDAAWSDFGTIAVPNVDDQIAHDEVPVL